MLLIHLRAADEYTQSGVGLVVVVEYIQSFVICYLGFITSQNGSDERIEIAGCELTRGHVR